MAVFFLCLHKFFYTLFDFIKKGEEKILENLHWTQNFLIYAVVVKWKFF